MIYFLSVYLIFFSGCNEPVSKLTPTTDTKEISNKMLSPGEIKNQSFKKLTSRFQYKELPLSSFYNDGFEVFDLQGLTLKEIYKEKRLPIDTAIKYFCKGVKECNNQPSGGIYEYYYGYRLPNQGDYVTLFYFRPSDDTWSYRIATFSYKGDLIDDIGIGGQKWEEAYKWFRINKDLSIHTEEILLDMADYTDEEGVEALRTDREYQIASTGKIELVKEVNLGQMTYIQDNTFESFRLKPKVVSHR